jgi:hypothetical protein
VVDEPEPELPLVLLPLEPVCPELVPVCPELVPV